MRIKNKRLSMGLTQESLSEDAGIGVQHLSKIENGKAPLSLTCLVSIANALQTTTDHLLMDNVSEAKTQLLQEVEAVYSDCTPAETFILVETSKALKQNIRIKNMPVSKL
jgi:transcriptional regulator with XRE-family HTH domain